MRDARLHLEYAYAAGSEPPIDAIIQTLYALEVLHGQSVRGLVDDRGRTDRRRYVRERELWLSQRPEWLWVPVASELPSRLQLRVEAVTMASPLDLILHLPHEVYALAGAAAVLRLIGGIERAWNAPRRIRLEGATLDRDYWLAAIDRERARRDYELRSPGTGPPHPEFELEKGSLEVPEDWAWPPDASPE